MINYCNELTLYLKIIQFTESVQLEGDQKQVIQNGFFQHCFFNLNQPKLERNQLLTDTFPDLTLSKNVPSDLASILMMLCSGTQYKCTVGSSTRTNGAVIKVIMMLFAVSASVIQRNWKSLKQKQEDHDHPTLLTCAKGLNDQNIST